MPSPVGDNILFDDFNGHVVMAAACSQGPWEVTADSGGTALTVDQPGGVLRLDTDCTDDDVIMVAAGRAAWRVQDGAIDVLFRAKVDDITTVAYSMGLTDANTESSTMPWHLGACDALTTTASTGIGFVFDTDAATDTIHTLYVDDDTDGTLTNTALAPVNATYRTYRIRLEDAGSGNQVRAEFSVCCNTYYEVRTSTIDRDVQLTPFVAVQNRAAAGRLFDVDYIYISGSRPDDC